MSDSADTHSSSTEEMVEIAVFPTEALAHEYALVVLSMRQASLITISETSPSSFSLFVDQEAADFIHHELQAYAQEMAIRAATPAKPIADEFAHAIGWEAILLWVLSLVSVFTWQCANDGLHDYVNSSIDVFQHHQWWRPFTSLFLHGDIYHLCGNLLSGIIFAALLTRLMGPWLGLTLMLLAGTLANVANAYIHQSVEFLSLGASTAVFAALGLICGCELIGLVKHKQRLPLTKVFAPVLGGLVLLGWLGMGTPGSNTDILGHVLGFSTGTALGMLAEPLTLPHKKNEDTPT